MSARRHLIAGLAALGRRRRRRAAAQARDFEGEIVARNGKAKTFSIREDEGGGTFKVRVKQTLYQGIPASARSRSAAATSRSPRAGRTAAGSPRWSSGAAAAAGTTTGSC